MRKAGWEAPYTDARTKQMSREVFDLDFRHLRCHSVQLAGSPDGALSEKVNVKGTYPIAIFPMAHACSRHVASDSINPLRGLKTRGAENTTAELK